MLLKIASSRMEVGALLGKAHVVTVVVVLAALALLLAERAGAELFVPWRWVGPALISAGLIETLRLRFAGRSTELEVAVEVDDRLELREKLSTALHCRSRTDPFARAAIEDAVGAARDPRVREQVRRRFAVTTPPRWWMSPLVILLAVGAWLIPPQNLFARDPSPDDPSMTQIVRDHDAAIDAVIRPIERNPELREELSDLLGELSNDGTDPDALKTRQDIQRDAIKKLTDINKRLNEILSGPKGKTAESVAKSLEKLRTPQDGPARDFAEAMAAGDFKAAKAALAKLQADLKAGALTKEQQEQLARQLEDLAEQLDQLARQQQQLEDMLRNAGMNPQLAQNPQLLQQAIQDNPNLNDQQKQQMQQMAQAQQAAGQMMQGLAQSLGQMAQDVQMGQLGEAGMQAVEQLSQLEALQQMLAEAQAAANACQGEAAGIGRGLGMQQAMQQWMKGRGAFGGPGQGAGGKAPIAPTPTRKRIVKSPSQITAGDIIARQFIDGPQVVGTSKAAMREVAGAVNRGYEEAVGDEQLPRKYHEAHMHYFGELKKLVEAVEEKGEATEEAEPERD